MLWRMFSFPMRYLFLIVAKTIWPCPTMEQCFEEREGGEEE
jgi:hypothetical protein